MSDETGQAVAGMDHRLADLDGHDHRAYRRHAESAKSGFLCGVRILRRAHWDRSRDCDLALAIVLNSRA
jgi:hypothetical protein